MRKNEKQADKARPREAGRYAPAVRREAAVVAAVQVLARFGARGLTHREIDRHLDWPAGSTSNYFRRRNDIFIAVAEWVMQQDLADFSTLAAEFAKATTITLETVAEGFARMLEKTMATEHQDRVFARSEILFESTRNELVRSATRLQIARADALFHSVFARLGSSNPLASAELFPFLTSGIYVSSLVATRTPDVDELRLLMRNWLSICVARD